MTGLRILVALVLVATVLSGCSGKAVEETVVVRPEEITERDVARIESLAAAFPSRYSFPGMAALKPVLGLFFNGTLAPGTGSTGIEFPNDDGPLDYGGHIERFDLASQVPVGQPVEIRANLKWWGDPGTSGDIDIWVDVPGTRDALDSGRYDETMNWNIVTKQRIVNTVHLEGQPFELGLQVNNGRIVHPDGMRYSLRVDLYFVDQALAPGVAYAISVPPNATGLVLKTERVTGDEHVDVSVLLVGPDDRLVRYIKHNDIGVDTLFIPVPGPGEYVVYAHHMHGGFVRLESEVPNPNFMARRLVLTSTDIVLHQGTPAPGTFAESGLGGNTWGAEGSFEIGPGFPLDVVPFIDASSGAVQAAINVSSTAGWVTTAFTCNPTTGTAPPVCAAAHSDSGRVGGQLRVRGNHANLATGPHTFGVAVASPGATLGVTVLGYTR